MLEPVVVSRPKVCHLGLFDPTLKRANASHEGKCLSVSTNPDAWIQIARLGGFPRHTLTKKDSKFLDFYAFAKDKKALIQWGVERKYVEFATVHRICYFDDESEQTMVFSTQDADEIADAEASGYRVERLSNSPACNASAVLKAGFSANGSSSFTYDILAVLYAEEADLDGVWWKDRLDPIRLSAPRGGILPHKVESWKVSRQNV